MVSDENAKPSAQVTSGSPLTRLLCRVVDFSARKPRTILLAFVLACIVCAGLAVTHLSINTDTDAMLNPELEFRKRQQAVEAAFPHLDNAIIILVRAEIPDEADFVTRLIAERLRGQPDRFAEVFAPSVDPYLLQNGLLFLEYDEFDSVTGRLSAAAPLMEGLVKDPSPARLFESLKLVSLASREGIDSPLIAVAYREFATVVEALLENEDRPLSWSKLIGAAADEPVTQRLMFVTPVLDFNALRPAKPAQEAANRIAEDIRAQYGDIAEVLITGDPVMRSDELKTVTDGILLSTGLSLVLVSLLLTFGLRSVRLVAAALGSLVIGLVLTAGFAAVAVGQLNLISIAFAVLLIGLGIDFSIHLCLNYQEHLDEGEAHRPALQHTMHQVGGALALCAPTTALAFFAFVPTDFVGMAQLGLVSGGGVILAFVVSVTCLPALLTVIPEPARRQNRQLLDLRIGHWIEHYAGWIAVLAVSLGFIALFLLPSVKFDADPMNLRDPESPSVIAFNHLFEKLETTPYRLEYLAKDLEEAQQVGLKVKQLGAVEAAVTLVDFVPDDQEDKLMLLEFLAGDLAPVFSDRPLPAYKKIEDMDSLNALLPALDEAIEVAAAQPARLQAAKRLRAALASLRERALEDRAILDALTERMLRHFPILISNLQHQLDADEITLDGLPQNIRSRFVAADGRARVEIIPAVAVENDAVRAGFVEEVRALQPDVTGAALSVLNAGKVIGRAMAVATLVAGFAASLLVLIVLRRLRTLALIVLPLMLAGILTAASGVVLGQPFNFTNVIVLPLLIGLGVDSGIHLVMRMRDHPEGRDIFSTSTPRAILLSAMTTIASFGTLSLNAHRGTASMGELLVVGISCTLLCTLVVLPGVIALRRRAAQRV